MPVSRFIICFNDMLFPTTGQAVVKLLERLGHIIDFPRPRPPAGSAGCRAV
jgi:L-lactate dehydrogenase complex protein LldE